MKLKRIGLVLALSCCSAGAARADWEYTKWGMTPQQVVSASKNVAKDSPEVRPDSDGNVTKLVAPYKAGKFSFDAEFAFDPSDRLSSVTLIMYDTLAGTDVHMDMHSDLAPGMTMNMDLGICHDLDMATNFAYGTPHYSGANHLYAIEKWRDDKNKNNIDFHSLFEVGCYVQYSVMK